MGPVRSTSFVGSVLLAISVCNAAPAPATQPSVRATTIEGQVLEGTWRGVDSQGTLQLAAPDGKAMTVAADKAMAVRFAASTATQPAADSGCVFYLADGSRFAGRLTAGNGRELSLTTRRASLKLRLDSLAAVRWSAPSSEEALGAFTKALAARDVSEDTLISVRQGHVTAVRGVTEQLAPDGGTFLWRQRNIPVRPDSTFAIVFAKGVQAAPTARAWCTLKDASIWGAESIHGDASRLVLNTTLGIPIEVETSEIAELRFRSDRVLLVSDLTPAQYVFEPFAVTRWPYRIDLSVGNTPLRLGGQTFERGLGMHSQSRLVYDLPGAFSQLVGTIGIDDAVRPRGNVVFRVMADGREVFREKMGGADAPKPIQVALSSPKRIELCVDFGDSLDIGDYADWGQVRLIK